MRHNTLLLLLPVTKYWSNLLRKYLNNLLVPDASWLFCFSWAGFGSSLGAERGFLQKKTFLPVYNPNHLRRRILPFGVGPGEHSGIFTWAWAHRLGAGCQGALNAVPIRRRTLGASLVIAGEGRGTRKTAGVGGKKEDTRTWRKAASPPPPPILGGGCPTQQVLWSVAPVLCRRGFGQGQG